MVRLKKYKGKRPSKQLCKRCRKYGIKVMIKRGNKKVYKSKRTLMKQLRKKMKMRRYKKSHRVHRRVRRTRRTRRVHRRSRFGYTPTWFQPQYLGTMTKKTSMFGKRRRRLGFGSKASGCGCGSKSMDKNAFYFGKRRKNTLKTSKKAMIKKLHRLCKVYRVKIGKKKPETLRKQCLKKARMMLRRALQKKRH